MTAIYNTYEQMANNSKDGGDYVRWAVKSSQKSRSMMISTDHINDNGSITKIHRPFTQTPGRDRIDGHFWLEDMEGNIISDGGFDSYKHKLPCFQDNLYDPKNDFVVYQPVPCPVMEQEIIDNEVNKLKKKWAHLVRESWRVES